MVIRRRWRLFLPLLAVAAYAAPALAQQPPAPAASTPKSTPKSTAKSTAKKPAGTEPAAPPAEPAAAVAGGAKPALLGQYGDWGAYYRFARRQKDLFCDRQAGDVETSPAGQTRNPPYMFIASRPGTR